MVRENFKESMRAGFVVGVSFQPGIDKWSDEPSPDGSLMVAAVARTKIAGINRFVFGSVGRKRAQANRRDQFLLHKIDYGIPAFRIENGMIERDGKNLIWPERFVVSVFLTVAIDHVVKITAF